MRITFCVKFVLVSMGIHHIFEEEYDEFKEEMNAKYRFNIDKGEAVLRLWGSLRAIRITTKLI